MVELNDRANGKLFGTVSTYIGRGCYYGQPPIFYWFRNVIEETKWLEQEDSTAPSGVYDMGKSLGRIYYSLATIRGVRIVVITDFDFNMATIRSYIRKTVPIAKVGRNASPFPMPYKCINIGNKVQLCRYRDGTQRLSVIGRNFGIPLKFDEFISPFRKHRDGYYARFKLDGREIKLTKEYVDLCIRHGIIPPMLDTNIIADKANNYISADRSRHGVDYISETTNTKNKTIKQKK